MNRLRLAMHCMFPNWSKRYKVAERSLSALAITETELRAMAALAKMGLGRIPNHG